MSVSTKSRGLEFYNELALQIKVEENSEEYAAILGTLYELANEEELSMTSSQLRPQLNNRLEKPISHEELEDNMNFLFTELLEEDSMQVRGTESPYFETRYVLKSENIVQAASEMRDLEDSSSDPYDDLKSEDDIDYLLEEENDYTDDYKVEPEQEEYLSIEDRFM